MRWHSLTIDSSYSDFADWCAKSRKKLQKVDRGCFDSLVILVSWIIWNERNRWTFDNVVSWITELLIAAREEASNWVLAGFKQLQPFFSCRRSIV
ncbi:hypothetical protein HU200_034901 [Digitaria exilis]|uniref:Uncharacterized protein n=1 Tax=Digitaria exilis TaxID=1010633 RepID=A0A835BJH7_9POAL|nr:hypothetical protein HU200_034901 [Digitaria exilis]